MDMTPMDTTAAGMPQHGAFESASTPPQLFDADAMMGVGGPEKRLAATKSTWTQQEDWQLTQLVGRFGAKNWSRIAQQLQSRSGKQCRERWRNHLNPEVCKEPFSTEEDDIIIRMVEVHGTKWARIAKSLTGRTDNAVKNRYNSSLRKSHEKRRRKPRVCIPSTPPDSPHHHTADGEAATQPTTIFDPEQLSAALSMPSSTLKPKFVDTAVPSPTHRQPHWQGFLNWDRTETEDKFHHSANSHFPDSKSPTNNTSSDLHTLSLVLNGLNDPTGEPKPHTPVPFTNVELVADRQPLVQLVLSAAVALCEMREVA